MRFVLAAAAALLAPLPVLAQTQVAGRAADAQCDATCLRGLADSFLAALLTHDAAALPRAPGFRYTENTVELSSDEGLWATASKGPGTSALYVPDPVSGQIGFFGVVEENGNPALLTFRLRAHRGRAAEIEAIVVRNTSALFNPATLSVVEPALVRPKPAGKRLSRDALIGIADAYFDGLELDTSAPVRFHPQCHRNENGVITAQPDDRPPPAPRLRPDGSIGPATKPRGCKAGFDSKAYSYIGAIAPRRWFAVDPERNLAMGIFMFVHPGTRANADVPGAENAVTGGGNVPQRNLRPFNTLIAEVFEIEDGRIREVLAVGTSLPYKIRSGWE